MLHWRRAAAAVVLLPVAALVLTACLPPPPPPVTVSCGDAGTAGGSVAVCHLSYTSYMIDPNPFAQQVADSIASSGATCANLAARHTPGPTLLAAYAGASSVGENLYCQTSGPGTCPSNAQGATNAVNAWLASPPHRANMDGFAGAWVVGGAACNPATGYYFAVAQFHRP